MSQQQTLSRVDVSRFETASQLVWLDLISFDSVVELTPRDTVSRIRHVRASITLRDSSDRVSTYTRTDTAAGRQTQIVVEPIAAESKKNGVVSLCAWVRMACWIIFLIFFTYLLLRVKKWLLLHR